LRLLIQRVARSEVRVRGEVVASGGPGLLILVGIGDADAEEEPQRMAAKVIKLRIFEDQEGKMNRSLADTGGDVVVVPQFTLYGDASRGNRPSWIHAAAPEVASRKVEEFVEALGALGASVSTGAFREHMEVELVNDGPVTLMLEA
jgi:D-tyrosyl-tRNA(Tyr) deacylase